MMKNLFLSLLLIFADGLMAQTVLVNDVPEFNGQFTVGKVKIGKHTYTLNGFAEPVSISQGNPVYRIDFAGQPTTQPLAATWYGSVRRVKYWLADQNGRVDVTVKFAE